MSDRVLSVHPMQREAIVEALRDLDAGDELHVFGHPQEGDPDAWPGGQWCDARYDDDRPIVFHRDARVFGVLDQQTVCMTCGEMQREGEDG